MKRLLLVVLALSLSVSAQMWPMPGPGSPAAAAPPAGGSFAVVHEYSVAGATTSSATNVSITSTTAGNALIFILECANNTDITVSGTTATQWFRVLPAGGISLQVLYSLNITGGITSVSLTPSASDKITGKVLEVSGLATTGAADVYASPSRTGFSAGNAAGITGAVTTTNASDVIFGIATFTTTAETYTAGTGYTQLTTATNVNRTVGVGYKTVSSTGTYNPGMTWTPSNNLTVATMAFKLQ